MECPLSAAKAAQTLELAPSARPLPKAPEANRRSRRAAPAHDDSADAGTRRKAFTGGRKCGTAGIMEYPTSDTEKKHPAGPYGDRIGQHSQGLGNDTLRRIRRSSLQSARHNADQDESARRAAMFCARKVPSRNSLTILGQPSCRTGARASGPPRARNLSDLPIFSFDRCQSNSPPAFGDAGCSATSADFREFGFAKRRSFGSGRNFGEQPRPSNRIPFQPSFGRKQQKHAPRCMQLGFATRNSCAAIAASHTHRAEFGPSRHREEERIRTETACRRFRRPTELERPCREATMPHYSTPQVCRIADAVLNENVSGEEASAILLALIVDPCAFSPDPAEFRRGPFVCRYSAENEFPPVGTSNGGGIRGMRRPPRTPKPLWTFRSLRASAHVISVAKSSSANSADSRAGSPRCAATRRRHALNSVAKRVFSPGGTTLPSRKRRHGRSAWNGNPSLVQQTERKRHDNW